LATATIAVVASAAVASLGAVIATSGPPDKATVSPLPITDSGMTATLTPASASATAADLAS
jgi:hypothetical protein